MISNITVKPLQRTQFNTGNLITKIKISFFKSAGKVNWTTTNLFSTYNKWFFDYQGEGLGGGGGRLAGSPTERLVQNEK